MANGGTPPCSPEPQDVQWRVSFRLLSGTLLAELQVCPTSTVASLKQAAAGLQAVKGVLHLVHNGSTLSEDQTVAEAGLCEHSTVFVVRGMGLRIAIGDGGGSVQIIDAEQGCCTATLAWNDSAVHSVAFSPDGARVALGTGERYPGDGTALVSLWHVESMCCERVLEVADCSCVRCVAFSPDGGSLATGCGNSLSGTVVFWSVESGQRQEVLEGHTHMLYAVAYSPCGELLATGSCDRTAKVWQVAASKCIGTFRLHEDSVLWAAFSPDSTLVATASEDGTAMLWSARDCSLVFSLLGHDDMVGCANFSPDGTLLVTGSCDGTARLWSTATGRSVRTILCSGEDVRFATFSPDGASIVTGSDNAVRLWNSETCKSRAAFEGTVPVAVSPAL